jgi:hypothetical protein
MMMMMRMNNTHHQQQQPHHMLLSSSPSKPMESSSLLERINISSFRRLSVGQLDNIKQEPQTLPRANQKSLSHAADPSDTKRRIRAETKKLLL